MSTVTRRGLLKRASAGAATIGALMAVPGLTTAHAAAIGRTSELSTHELHGPLVAHVSDIASGEIAIMVGDREVIVRDPELVLRLVKATR